VAARQQEIGALLEPLAVRLELGLRRTRAERIDFGCIAHLPSQLAFGRAMATPHNTART
jgi:hypothetical protein